MRFLIITIWTHHDYLDSFPDVSSPLGPLSSQRHSLITGSLRGSYPSVAEDACQCPSDQAPDLKARHGCCSLSRTRNILGLVTTMAGMGCMEFFVCERGGGRQAMAEGAKFGEAGTQTLRDVASQDPIASHVTPYLHEVHHEPRGRALPDNVHEEIRQCQEPCPWVTDHLK